MRVVTNNKLAKRNRQMATYLFLGTFVVLGGGFLFINISLFTQDVPDDPSILLLQSLILPIAFVLTIVSVRMTNLWARQPYPDKAIEDGLKGLSKKSILYNYYHFPARHVLICPQGVFTITTRWHNGRYTVEGSKWKNHQGIIAKWFSFFRMDGIRNPTVDAVQAANKLEKTMKSIAPDVDIQPLVVMIDPKADVTIKEPAIPVLYADPKSKPNLKDFMRRVNRESDDKSGDLPLTDEQIEAFEAATL